MEKNCKIKAIFIDLDGTLLNNQDQILPTTLSSLIKARHKKIKIIITTGRTLSQLPKFPDNLKIDYYIISNGACILDAQKKIIYQQGLSSKQARSILKLCKKNNLLIELNIKGQVYYQKEQLTNLTDLKVPQKHLSKLSDIGISVDNLKTILTKQTIIEKINLFCLKEDYNDLKTKIIAQFKNINVVSGGMENIEITNTSKGKAIKYLSSLMEIDLKYCLAIGDSENDLEMIQTVKYGVAMANACNLLKEKAVYVTDSNLNNGVGKIIDLLLKEEKNDSLSTRL